MAARKAESSEHDCEFAGMMPRCPKPSILNIKPKRGEGVGRGGSKKARSARASDVSKGS